VVRISFPFSFKIVYSPGKQGQKPDALTRMSEDIRPKGGAEKTLNIIVKTENLDKELRKNMIMVFAETVNLDNDPTSTEELCNWVKRVCQQCPYDSSKGLDTHKEQLLGMDEIQIQPTDQEKLKWIQECHDSPVAGHTGRAKTYDLLSQSHSWNLIRKDVDCYV
jgi:hypothetical protein